MTDAGDDETKVGARPAFLDEMDAARDFPNNTCGSSRHMQMCAEALATTGRYGLIEDDPSHVASSLATVVTSLWTARSFLLGLGYTWGPGEDGKLGWMKVEPKEGSTSRT